LGASAPSLAVRSAVTPAVVPRARDDLPGYEPDHDDSECEQRDLGEPRTVDCRRCDGDGLHDMTLFDDEQ